MIVLYALGRPPPPANVTPCRASPATAALVLASTPIGASVDSALHLGVVIILMLVMLLIDGHGPGAPLSRAART
ncbi:hypothetical protein [Micromonospora rhizosphaerae]|uniref:hypothetical protein n=1 Tax=Micromonospora rhizosphaerae TaxID=568872 RepID=UPI00159F07DD|nr:hypothetical protein [Micromonospora rhizosphaerae]